MREPPESETHQWVRIAVSRDPGVAEEWADALLHEGIEARVEIDDDRNTPVHPPPLFPYVGTRHVYPVAVPSSEGERAAAIIDAHRERAAEAAAPDGRRITTVTLLVLGATLAVVLVLVALGD